MKDPKREGKRERVAGQVANILTLLASLLLAASRCGAETASGPGIPNIFKPESTPAESIYRLSLLVLSVTGIIFVIVFGLIAYAISKFRKHSSDGPEPPQVYGSNQIETA